MKKIISLLVMIVFALNLNFVNAANKKPTSAKVNNKKIELYGYTGTYTGWFYNNKANGYGTFIYKNIIGDTDKITGTWKNNVVVGKGTLERTIIDGKTIFTGYITGDDANGYGIEKDYLKSVLDSINVGTFKDNNLVKGKMTIYDNGKVSAIYEGTFQLEDGNIDGTYKRTFYDEKGKSKGSMYGTFVNSKKIITLSDYYKISTGMTYRQVVNILDDLGTQKSNSDTDFGDGDTYSVSYYEWTNPDNSVISIIFENDKVSVKTQFGLK